MTYELEKFQLFRLHTFPSSPTQHTNRGVIHKGHLRYKINNKILKNNLVKTETSKKSRKILWKPRTNVSVIELI